MRTLTLILPAALLAGLASAQNVNDVIIKKDGARVRGVEITEFLLTGVRGKRGGEAFELPAYQVLDVEWSNPPEEFLAGKSAMERGDFATATQMFGAVASERELVKKDAEFFTIKAAVAAIGNDQAAAQTAAEKAKAWLSSNTNHWRTPEALLLAGRAERLAGTGGTAATTLKELDDRSIGENFGIVWSARAKFELALTLLADGKASEARTQFKSAAQVAEAAMGSASAADKAELQNLITTASVGEGETYLAEQSYDRAQTFFRTLTSQQDLALQAAGHAGIGEALFLSADGNADELRKAQMSLARASVLDPSASEASAKANYYLGRCLLGLGADRAGETFRDRAMAYFRIVYTSYPTTRWAGLAKAESQR